MPLYRIEVTPLSFMLIAWFRTKPVQYIHDFPQLRAKLGINSLRPSSSTIWHDRTNSEWLGGLVRLSTMHPSTIIYK